MYLFSCKQVDNPVFIIPVYYTLCGGDRIHIIFSLETGRGNIMLAFLR